MKTIVELIEAFKAGSLKLPEMFDALVQRGVLPESDHRAEVDYLERLRLNDELDPPLIRAVLSKLEAVQRGPANEDFTVVKPTTVLPPVNPDATVVKPASNPSGPVDDEATIVKPTSGSGRPEEPTTTTTGTQGFTGTTSGTGSNTSTWQRLADAPGGDYVAVGVFLKGRFFLEKEIGRGGMGVVYKARDDRKVEARDRDPYVAVKVLNDEFRRHPDSLIALQRESRRAQNLAHDNILRVFDFDKDGSIVFVTMEYIDGSDLRALVREHAYNGISLSEARPLIVGMALALSRAHAAGIVHSDFKPSNVMVTSDGIPKVFDFGIARAVQHLGGATGEQTVFDAATLGALTPAYASLEMLQGKAPTPSDDIYALGCVAFELLTGRHPYDRVSAEVAMREHRRPPPVPGLTKRQYRILQASVAFTSEHRPQKVEELIDGLRTVGLRERAAPYVIPGLVSAVVLAAGTWGMTNYLHHRRIQRVIDGFSLTNPHHYVKAGEALAALNNLQEDDRKRVILDQNERIQSFLLDRVEASWDPGADRYDYAEAERVFDVRDELKMYAPKLDLKRGQVEQEKNNLLNTLDTQLAERIEAGAIFEDQPNSAVATLARIRAIDPNSGLLKNTQLELKYDLAIGASLAAGRIDEAKRRADLATRLFPQSASLRQRAAQLAQIDNAARIQEQEQQASQQKEQQRRASLQTLDALLDRADGSVAWRTQLASAYQNARKLPGAEAGFEGQTTRLEQVLAAQTGRKQASGDLGGAIELAGFGINLLPADENLADTRLQLLRDQLARGPAGETAAQRGERAKVGVRNALAQSAATPAAAQDLVAALEFERAQLGAGAPDYVSARQQARTAIIKSAQDRLAAGDLGSAQGIVGSGRVLDPSDAGFSKVASAIADARGQEKNKAVTQLVESRTNARKALASLTLNPSATADWQSAVTAAVTTLQNDNSPDTRRLMTSLGDAIASQTSKLSDPEHLPQARFQVDFGLRVVPWSSRLRAESSRLDALERQSQAKVTQEGVDAEVQARIESVKRAAAANDLAKARESLDRVRTLEPNNPFLKVEGPELLADTYLGLANDAFLRTRYHEAAEMVARGLEALGNRQDLRNAKARYEVVAAIMAAGNQTLSPRDYQQLKSQLDRAREADAYAMSKLETDMRARGQLAERSLAERLQKLRPAPVSGSSAASPVAAAPAVPGQLAMVPRPGAAPPRAAAPSQKGEVEATPTPQAPPAAQPAPAPASNDPCAKPSLVGSGSCYDMVAGHRGPRLVVVPGSDGGKPYALSRAEISLVDFSIFCAATGKCSTAAPGDPDQAGTPVSNIPVTQAKAYTSWLTEASGGYIYRLPSDAEWLHAAGGGSGWKQADNSNCVLPSSNGDDSAVGALVSAKGRDPNPWGLVNMTGNVWEWVTSGGKLMVRGGSFNSYWSDCTVDAHRDDSGQPQKDVGFRVLRELK